MVGAGFKQVHAESKGIVSTVQWSVQAVVLSSCFCSSALAASESNDGNLISCLMACTKTTLDKLQPAFQTDSLVCASAKHRLSSVYLHLLYSRQTEIHVFTDR